MQTQLENLHDLPENPILSVKEISLALKKTVEQTYGYIRIRGEVSGLKRHTSGHLYYALKDEEAVLDAVSWRGSYNHSPVALEDGLEIIALGRLTTYPGRSKYQMVVERFEASGQGALLKLLEERKQKLAAEGLFSPTRKKPLPRLPQTIGVITSPTGAVIRDILHRIEDRFPCHVVVWPVLVQGTGAAEQISTAIQGFNQSPQKPDVLIVARGGGSIEDLWAFNEEIVVRAAALSTIPLISAVGHETDTTLIDYAADVRAPTPTAAAELAVPEIATLRQMTKEREQRLTIAIDKHLQHVSLHLSVAARGLIHPKNYLEDRLLKVDDLTERLQRGVVTLLSFMTQKSTSLGNTLRRPDEIIYQAHLQLDQWNQRLERSFTVYMTTITQNFDQLDLRLRQASVEKVLERGFCLVLDASGRPIASEKQAPAQEPFTLKFHDGTAQVIRHRPPIQPRLF